MSLFSRHGKANRLIITSFPNRIWFFARTQGVLLCPLTPISVRYGRVCTATLLNENLTKCLAKSFLFVILLDIILWLNSMRTMIIIRNVCSSWHHLRGYFLEYYSHRSPKLYLENSYVKSRHWTRCRDISSIIAWLFPKYINLFLYFPNSSDTFSFLLNKCRNEYLGTVMIKMYRFPYTNIFCILKQTNKQKLDKKERSIDKHFNFIIVVNICDFIVSCLKYFHKI